MYQVERGDLKCRDQFVRVFGEKAFRRPLNEVEIRRYNDLFAEQASRTGKFLEGARVVVEAMLQSPKFLFHVTAGPPSRNATADKQRDYAIANRSVIPPVGHDARSRAS